MVGLQQSGDSSIVGRSDRKYRSTNSSQQPKEPKSKQTVDEIDNEDAKREISSKKSKEQALESLLEEDIAPDELRQRLITSITEFEHSFRKEFPLIWFATLVGPALLTIAILVGIGIFDSPNAALKYVYAAVATFIALGRFVILTGQDPEALAAAAGDSWVTDLGMTSGQLFGMLTYMDLLIALFVTFHMGILFRVPWLGGKIAGLASDGKFIMEQQPWLRRLAVFALIGFVIFPTSTTGSIGGSIFGRLLGLGRFRTVLGVAIGSMLGNGIMYFFAKEINQWMGPDSFWLKMSGVLILVAGVMFIEWRYRKAKNKYLEDQANRQSNKTDA